MLRAWGCRSEIENGKILYLADKARDWQSLGLRYACLRFTTESPEDCVRMLRAYQGETVEAPGEYHPWSLLSRRRMNSKL